MKGPQHRHFIRRHGATEKRHIFLCYEIRHSGKRDSRLVRITLLTDFSMNATACASPHKSGAAWKEERIEMNTCDGTSTIVVLGSSCFDGIRYGTRNLTKMYRTFDSV